MQSENHVHRAAPLGTVSSGIFIFGVLPFCFFDRLNITGIVKRTLTALPSAIPGDHLGIVFTTRKASSSNRGSTPLTTFPCPGVPSSITTNWIITRPETPFFWASTGYFTLVAKYSSWLACLPETSASHRELNKLPHYLFWGLTLSVQTMANTETTL